MKSIIITVFLIFLALLSCSVYPVRSFTTSNGVYASVQEASTEPLVAVCGNGIKEAGEQCDGTDLSG